MSNLPTSRPEPDALHRSVMQAAEQVARLDARVEEERRRDGLAPFLTSWRDASAGLRAERLFILRRVGEDAGGGAPCSRKLKDSA